MLEGDTVTVADVAALESRLDGIAKVGRKERRTMLANCEQAADSWRRADMEEIEQRDMERLIRTAHLI